MLLDLDYVIYNKTRDFLQYVVPSLSLSHHIWQSDTIATNNGCIVSALVYSLSSCRCSVPSRNCVTQKFQFIGFELVALTVF